jgi:hypothetical protein
VAVPGRAERAVGLSASATGVACTRASANEPVGGAVLSVPPGSAAAVVLLLVLVLVTSMAGSGSSSPPQATITIARARIARWRSRRAVMPGGPGG